MHGVGDGGQVRPRHAIKPAAPLLLARLILILWQGAPSIMIGQRGDPQPTLVQRPALAVMVIVRDTDDPRGRIDESVRRPVTEALCITEENDGVLPSETSEGLGVIRRDGLGVTQSTDLSGRGRRSRVRTEAHRLDGASRGVDGVGGDLRAVVEDERGRTAGPYFDACHAALHTTLDTVLATTVRQQADDLAHADERTREAFSEE